MPSTDIRPGRAGDEHAIWTLIRELAEYEKLETSGGPEALGQDLFSKPAAAETLVAEQDGEIVAYALFFSTYSTFRTQPGIYLEDLYVRRECRGRGIGKTLLGRVAQTAVERGCGRLEWSVLDWNQPAIDFYLALGAQPLEDWTMHRLSGTALEHLAREGR